MNMVFPDMEENELFKNELLEIVVDVTGFLPELRKSKEQMFTASVLLKELVI